MIYNIFLVDTKVVSVELLEESTGKVSYYILTGPRIIQETIPKASWTLLKIRYPQLLMRRVCK